MIDLPTIKPNFKNARCICNKPLTQWHKDECPALKNDTFFFVYGIKEHRYTDESDEREKTSQEKKALLKYGTLAQINFVPLDEYWDKFLIQEEWKSGGIRQSFVVWDEPYPWTEGRGD